MGAPSGHACPICGKEASSSPDNKSRPFCSARCKLIDLDRWFSGTYRVPGPPVESSSMGDDDRITNADVDELDELRKLN